MLDNITSYSKQVSSFKQKWCNENDLIIDLLKNKFNNYFVEPIVDVGAGMGDIANGVFKDKKAVCIDVSIASQENNDLFINHIWKQIDFFEYQPICTVGTLLFSHSLQFLDEDIILLNDKIQQLNPKFIIFILNDNTELFGEIVALTLSKYKLANPEINVLNQLKSIGTLVSSCSFEATLQCENFDQLTEQISYLMLCYSSDFKQEIKNLLIKYLNTPIILIKQTIFIYER